nr:MAG TPA: hypothetical protein [Caudoviricetes sp.]
MIFTPYSEESGSNSGSLLFSILGRILCPLLVFENGQKPTFFGNI